MPWMQNQMESFYKEVECALIHGIPVEEHLADLRLQPSRSSRLTTTRCKSPLRNISTEHQREIEHVGGWRKKKAAYVLVKSNRKTLADGLTLDAAKRGCTATCNENYFFPISAE